MKPFKSPERPKRLDGLEGWLRERFIRHRGNADVVRQDLLAEKGVAVSRRTLQRAVQPYRQALKAEALATTRFETPPGRQLQIDFGERLVEIGGAKIKAFVFVATLGHSRRLHVRAFRAEHGQGGRTLPLFVDSLPHVYAWHRPYLRATLHALNAIGRVQKSIT